MIVSTGMSRFGPQQPADVDAAQQVKAGIDDEYLRERLGQILGVAREIDDLADGPERRHRHEVGLHQAAGGLLRIEQVALQRRAVALRDLVEDLLLVVGLEAADEVGRVVAVEIGDGLGENVVGQRFRDLVAHLLVDLGQHLEVEVRAQRLDEADALLRARAARSDRRGRALARRRRACAPWPCRGLQAPPRRRARAPRSARCRRSCAAVSCSSSVIESALLEGRGRSKARPSSTRATPW